MQCACVGLPRTSGDTSVGQPRRSLPISRAATPILGTQCRRASSLISAKERTLLSTGSREGRDPRPWPRPTVSCHAMLCHVMTMSACCARPDGEQSVGKAVIAWSHRRVSVALGLRHTSTSCFLCIQSSQFAIRLIDPTRRRRAPNCRMTGQRRQSQHRPAARPPRRPCTLVHHRNFPSSLLDGAIQPVLSSSCPETLASCPNSRTDEHAPGLDCESPLVPRRKGARRQSIFAPPRIQVSSTRTPPTSPQVRHPCNKTTK